MIEADNEGVTRIAAPQKLDFRIDVPATEDMVDKLAALASLHGKRKSEMARELLTVQIEGMYALMRANMSWPTLPSDGKK